jgi:predicted DNA-binding transcriptional regulator AlpA
MQGRTHGSAQACAGEEADVPDSQQAPRMLYSIPDVMNAISCKRSLVYGLIKSGELERVKIGKRALVTESSLVRFVARRVQAGRDKADAGTC